MQSRAHCEGPGPDLAQARAWEFRLPWLCHSVNIKIMLIEIKTCKQVLLEVSKRHLDRTENGNIGRKSHKSQEWKEGFFYKVCELKEKANKQRRTQRRIHQSSIPKEISSIKQFNSYGESVKIEKDSRCAIGIMISEHNPCIKRGQHVKSNS